jgi:hypothetical protein
LRHEAADEGLLLGDDAVGALEDAGDKDDDVEEVVKGGFRVDFEGGGDPGWLGKKGLLVVEEGDTNLDELGLEWTH